MALSDLPFVAVVDPTVLLDVYSCHELTRTYDKVREAGVDGAEAVYRRARARESVLLAIHLHRIKARTVSLERELLKTLTRNVDPRTDQNFETPFTKMMVHFVSQEVL